MQIYKITHAFARKFAGCQFSIIGNLQRCAAPLLTNNPVRCHPEAERSEDEGSPGWLDYVC